MISPLTRWMLDLQVAMLRRNWMGGMGNFVLVITTTGRRSGRPIATPIGYVRDGDNYLAVTYAPARTNWYANLRARPEALLEVRGQPVPVSAEFLEDEAARQAAVATFRREIPDRFKMMFTVPADAAPDVLAKAVAERNFVRFRPRITAPRQ